MDGSGMDTDVLCCQLFAHLGDVLPVPECGTTATSGADSGADGGGADAAMDAGLMSSTDAGQGPGMANRAVVCDLWTSGAAELRVESDSYPVVAESLTAQVDEACESSILVEERFVLPPPPDGGL